MLVRVIVFVILTGLCTDKRRPQHAQGTSNDSDNDGMSAAGGALKRAASDAQQVSQKNRQGGQEGGFLHSRTLTCRLCPCACSVCVCCRGPRPRREVPCGCGRVCRRVESWNYAMPY